MSPWATSRDIIPRQAQHFHREPERSAFQKLFFLPQYVWSSSMDEVMLESIQSSQLDPDRVYGFLTSYRNSDGTGDGLLPAH